MTNVPQTSVLSTPPQNDPSLASRPSTRPQATVALGVSSKVWNVILHIGSESSQALALNISGQLSVGRADALDGFMPGLDLSPFGAQDAGVSRRHAAIYPHENALLLRDLGSTNGTFLNGFSLDRNKSYKLSDGDEIEFGQLRVRLRIVQQNAQAPG